ncbi:MAG: ArsR/SmtB family transcription factor [Hyphomicrobiaceae bacterium]
MDNETAIRSLAALAQEHRLAIFRRLVAAGEAGQTAGQLAEGIGIAAQGLSFHVKELERAGLVSAAREGRFIRYRLVVPAMRELLTFLTEDCCGGRPELCGGLPVPSTACCPPPSKGSSHVSVKRR